MPPRTRLTAPPGEQPRTDLRGDGDDERYVPALDLPREPRVPGRHRTKLLVTVAVVTLLVLVVAGVLIGEQAQQEDPSVPDVPGLEDPTLDAPEDGSLPE